MDEYGIIPRVEFADGEVELLLPFLPFRLEAS